MKFSCTQENLYQGLFVTSHIASKSTNLPILNNILIKIEEKTIKFISTNLEVGINCVVRGKVEKEGEFTINSKLFFEYIGLLPNDRVDIEVNDPFLEIRCKNFYTKIKGIPATEYPLLPQMERKIGYKIKKEEFKKAVSQVIFAVAMSETRPEINGVLFQFKENQLTLAATDSYRLAERKVSVEALGATEPQRLIIPTKTLQEIQRIIGGSTEQDTLEIYVGEGQILFVMDQIELISRVIEGMYPDYEQILASNYKTTSSMSKEDLYKATKSASLFSRQEIFDVALQMNPDAKSVSVVSTNSQLGESKTDMEATFEGEKNAITLNYKYLLDGLNCVNTEKVKLQVIDENNHCVLRPEGEEPYLYVIMPIKQ